MSMEIVIKIILLLVLILKVQVYRNLLKDSKLKEVNKNFWKAKN